MTRSLSPDATAHLERMPAFNPVLAAFVCDHASGLTLTRDQLRAIDWQRTLPEAEQQGVAPIVYQRLRRESLLDCLPDDAVYTLRKAYHRAWVRNLLHLRILERAVLALAAVGIRPILLKGASLIATVYDEPALRPMRDVDLLVAPEEFRPALSQLVATGSQPTQGEPFDGAYELVSHHVGLVYHEETDILVELHHQWLSLPVQHVGVIDVAELRSRAQPVAIGNTHADALCAEDQVLQLAGHMAFHSPVLERLIWYTDIDRVVRHAGGDLDWDTIMHRAQRYLMALPLQHVLAAAVDWLGTPLPPAVSHRLISLPVSAVERQRYGAAALGPPSRLEDGMQKLAGLDSTSARLRFAGRMVFPTREYMRSLYGDDGPARLASRYPARWLEILREFARVARP